MLSIFTRILIILSVNLISSLPLYAEGKSVEQKNVAFTVKPEKLLKGEFHFFIEELSSKKLKNLYPEFTSLDSLGLLQESGLKIVISKHVSIIKKPVGFFEDRQLTDERFVAHLLEGQKVKKISPETFKVTVPGEAGYSYQIQSFFDADDISTLPNSKIIKAVTTAKDLDVISKGASTIMFSERTKFSRYARGGVSVSSFIPMKEDRTLIITYNLWAFSKKEVSGLDLKKSLLEELEGTREAMESFSP
jgi:hypothetical protein